MNTDVPPRGLVWLRSNPLGLSLVALSAATTITVTAAVIIWIANRF